MKRKFGVFLILIVFFALGGCGGSRITSAVTSGTLRIARGVALNYASIYVMERKGLLEKYLPGIRIDWIELGSPSAMSEAFAANRLDISVMGIPQTAIAWDKGLNIGILSGNVSSPSELIVRDSRIKSLADFTSSDKIAVNGLGANYQIMLSIASERELGDPHALDNNLVVMANPDATTALIKGGGISAHFVPLPYLAQEKNLGFKTILTGPEAFGGDYSASVIVASKTLHDENPAIMAGFLAALSESISSINQRHSDVLSIIAETEKITVEEVRQYLDWDGMNFTTVVYGLDVFTDYMFKENYISKKPTLEDILWEPALAAIGKRSGEPGILEVAQKRVAPPPPPPPQIGILGNSLASLNSSCNIEKTV
ncbi:ABC transporter substrate-binding protein [Treponema primitia]|uniref:ABC transporter substrate-binding protein n=1 Tax=Treponema primitia TaxID=88058 RepID=UPI0002554EE9|nr:ABC transporter substrate-binding protein [Treponema primitia]